MEYKHESMRRRFKSWVEGKKEWTLRGKNEVSWKKRNRASKSFAVSKFKSKRQPPKEPSPYSLLGLNFQRLEWYRVKWKGGTYESLSHDIPRVVREGNIILHKPVNSRKRRSVGMKIPKVGEEGAETEDEMI